MVALQIQRLYTAAVLIAASTILIWTKIMNPGSVELATIVHNKLAELPANVPANNLMKDTPQVTTFKTEEDHISTWLSELKRAKNEMKMVCKRHKYSLDSQRPRFLNCTNIFKGSKIEQNKIKYGHGKRMWTVQSDNAFYRQVKTCSWIRNQVDTGYYVSEEEKQFPLAFAINVYQSPYQIFRFLKVIYRPHNLYCLHYDKKSSESFKKLMITIANCLPNVIVPKKIADVIWGWHTIVDAQMNCLNDLYEQQNKYPWQYAITLCGKEVPLRTNREMVNTLRKLNGTSAVELEKHNDYEYDYWKYEHYLVENVVTQSDVRLGPIPFNLTMSKSMAYYGLSRTFVAFLLQSKKVKIFRKFMDRTKISDEHFIPTLYNARGMPGGRDDKYAHLVPTTSSYIWLLNPWQAHYCKGDRVHDICVVASGDLHLLDYSYDPHKDHQTFFHNKFFIERDRVVMDCAEEELLRRNRQECHRDTDLIL